MDKDREKRLRRIGRFSKGSFISFIFLLFGIVGFSCFMALKLSNAYLLIVIIPSAFGLVAIGFRDILKKSLAIEQTDLMQNCNGVPADEVRKLLQSINEMKLESDTKGSSSFDEYSSNPIDETSEIIEPEGEIQ